MVTALGRFGGVRGAGFAAAFAGSSAILGRFASISSRLWLNSTKKFNRSSISLVAEAAADVSPSAMELAKALPECDGATAASEMHDKLTGGRDEASEPLHVTNVAKRVNRCTRALSLRRV